MATIRRKSSGEFTITPPKKQTEEIEITQSSSEEITEIPRETPAEPEPSVLFIARPSPVQESRKHPRNVPKFSSLK